jgi:hypothetical protein
MSRVTTIVKTSIDSDINILPFLFINPQFGYSVNSILRDLHTSPKVFLKPDVFPHDVHEYYWIQEGEPGKKSWYALGLLDDNIYFLYRAYTDNRFETEGHMDLWVSYNFSDIIQYAMDTSVYDAYITSTHVVTTDQVITDTQNKISDQPVSELSMN